MPDDSVTLDVFLVTVTVPPDLPAPAVATVRRILNRAPVADRLRAAVTDLVRQCPALGVVTVSVSR